MLRFLIAFFSFSLLYAQQKAAPQREFPKDYFGSPLDIPLSYAGNFCELRPNHFHGGLDIKTDGKEREFDVRKVIFYLQKRDSFSNFVA